MNINPGIKYIILSAFYFSLMNVGVKFLSNIPSYEIVLFRAFISLIICVVSIRRLNISYFGNHKKYLFLRGLFGTMGLLIYFYTLQNMPLASAVTLQYLSPIFATILAGFILKEPAKPIQWLFFAVSFSGVLLIKGFDNRISLSLLLLGVSAALMSGFAYNYVRKLKDYDHPLVIIFYFTLVTVPLLTPYTILNWVMPKGWDWIILLMIGVLTQIAQLYMTKAYQSEQLSIISGFNYLGTVFALIFGYFLFGEIVSLASLGGIFLIVGGILLNIRFKYQAEKSKA